MGNEDEMSELTTTDLSKIGKLCRSFREVPRSEIENMYLLKRKSYFLTEYELNEKRYGLIQGIPDEKIIQIMTPCEHTNAVFRLPIHDDDPVEEWSLCTATVHAWALVAAFSYDNHGKPVRDQDDLGHMVGMYFDGELKEMRPCESSRFFVGYANSEEDIKDFIMQTTAAP